MLSLSIIHLIKGDDPDVQRIKLKEPTNGMFLQNTASGPQILNEDCIGITKSSRPRLFDVPCDHPVYNGKKLLPLCQRNEIREQGILFIPIFYAFNDKTNA